jgi:hypothetical protein
MSDKTTMKNKLFFHLSVRAIQVNGGSPSNLVSQRFCRDDGDFLDDALVGVEIDGQASVVLLDDDLRGLLDGFRSDTTLKGEGEVSWGEFEIKGEGI